MNEPFSKGKATMAHTRHQLTNRTDNAIRRLMGKVILLFTPLMASVLSGCVQVTAPDKPIVINLNIAIRQEILYKLAAASEKVIEENPEIF
jgi:allophanate hydrolase subunit 2